MPRIEMRPNESIEKALRRLKKKIEREGILRQIRARKHYEKPSIKKRRKQKEASKRRRR